jgi:hypothetical protein
MRSCSPEIKNKMRDSMAKNVDAIRRLFDIDPSRDRAGKLRSLRRIFPGDPAPSAILTVGANL